MKRAAILALALPVFQQQQCSVGTIVQGKAAAGIREYFPEAEVMNVLPCTLTIETHVPNVSKKLLIELAHRLFHSQEARELVLGMELAGYNYFILGFTYNTIVFDRYRSMYYVFDSVETARFFQTNPNFFCAPR